MYVMIYESINMKNIHKNISRIYIYIKIKVTEQIIFEMKCPIYHIMYFLRIFRCAFMLILD